MNLFNRKKGFFSSREADVFILEFNSGNLRLAYIKGFRGKKEVVFLENKDIQTLSEEDSKEIVNSFLEKVKAESFYTICSIPPHLAISKNIEVPSLDPKEIDDIMNLQVTKHTPYSREEIIIDYVKLGVYQRSYTKVLLIIVPREVVRRQYQLLGKLGIEPYKVCFSSESIVKFFYKTLRQQQPKYPFIAVNIDSAFTDFTVSSQGNLIFVRSIPIGIQHLKTDSVRFREKFKEEMKKSLEVYKSEGIEKTPVRLVILGWEKIVKEELFPYLNSNLDLPVDFVFYPEQLPLSSQVKDIILASEHTSFLNVITSGLSFSDTQFNLIPEEVKLRRVFEEKSKEIVKMGVMVMAIFIFICLFFGGRLYLKMFYFHRLNEKFKSIHKEAEKVEGEFNKIQWLRRYLTKRGYSLEVLGEIYNYLPKKVKILEIGFDSQGTFSIKGTADNLGEIISFVEGLNKSSLFEEVKTTHTTKRKEDEKDVTDFELVIRIAKVLRERKE